MITKINYDAATNSFVAKTFDEKIRFNDIATMIKSIYKNHSDYLFRWRNSNEHLKRFFLQDIESYYLNYERKDSSELNYDPIVIEFDNDFFDNFRICYPYFDEKALARVHKVNFEKHFEAFYRNRPYGACQEDERQELTFFTLLYMFTFRDHPIELELLSKIEGFEKIINSWVMCDSETIFTRSFKKGKNIDEVTQMRKPVWKTLLLAEPNIELWNVIRIWNNQIQKEQKKNNNRIVTGLTGDELDLILSLGLEPNYLDKFRKILKNAKGENDKPLFTISSLAEYIRRLDMYQAIYTYEALDLLGDYIKMCNDLGVSPNIKSDSLKRDHDVTARNHRVYQEQKYQEWEKNKGESFEKHSKELQKYEFELDNLVAITPKSISQLINEGAQNHNCVGSYVDAFSKAKTNIFFIRKKDDINSSYITVELNRDCTKTRQVYYACNRPVTNPVDLYFIKQWLKHNEEVNAND